MTQRATAWLICLTAGLWGSACVAWDDCEHTAPKELSMGADGVQLVEIRASAGYLKVEGVDGDRVEVRGTACASDADRLDEIDIVAQREDRTLVLQVVIPEAAWRWNGSARLDLDVVVPSSVGLKIDDGSGEIRVTRVAAVTVDDGSGEIVISQIAGDVDIEDGSGGIEVRDVRGTVRIDDDGSGEIDVADVGGDVEIGEDGSGSIAVERVAGSVWIGEDGSGSIAVDDVGGDFTVRRDGSGSIRHDRVRGSVQVPRD